MLLTKYRAVVRDFLLSERGGVEGKTADAKKGTSNQGVGPLSSRVLLACNCQQDLVAKCVASWVKCVDIKRLLRLGEEHSLVLAGFPLYDLVKSIFSIWRCHSQCTLHAAADVLLPRR